MINIKPPEEPKMNNCKFDSLKVGQSIEIGVDGEYTLFMNRDEKGLYIIGLGECTSDIYRPKYCPECGRKLNGK